MLTGVASQPHLTFFILGRYQKMGHISPFPWKNDKIIILIFYLILVYRCIKIHLNFLFWYKLLYVFLYVYKLFHQRIRAQKNSSHIRHIYLCTHMVDTYYIAYLWKMIYLINFEMPPKVETAWRLYRSRNIKNCFHKYNTNTYLSSSSKYIFKLL